MLWQLAAQAASWELRAEMRAADNPPKIPGPEVVLYYLQEELAMPLLFLLALTGSRASCRLQDDSISLPSPPEIGGSHELGLFAEDSGTDMSGGVIGGHRSLDRLIY